jgi:uncharacterized protein YneR
MIDCKSLLALIFYEKLGGNKNGNRIKKQNCLQDTNRIRYKWRLLGWNLQALNKAKSIPSPFGSQNMVDTSTLEDLVETQEMGRRSAGSMEVEGAFEKKYKDEMVTNEGKKLDFIILYGTDGKGSEGICAFIGQESFAPGEASDDHLTGTATVSVQTVPKWIEDNYDVAVTEDDQGYPTGITLTKKS